MLSVKPAFSLSSFTFIKMLFSSFSLSAIRAFLWIGHRYELNKQTEENNRTGKTRDPFKKIRDTKGSFHAKMGSIKDRNGLDLTEAEDIKKRWQEYTQELYKKDLHDQYNHRGVITHLEPDILECKSSGP